jgi:hypothetical protein
MSSSVGGLPGVNGLQSRWTVVYVVHCPHELIAFERRVVGEATRGHKLLLSTAEDLENPLLRTARMNTEMRPLA